MAAEKPLFGVYRIIGHLHTSCTLGKTSASMLEFRNKNVLITIFLYLKFAVGPNSRTEFRNIFKQLHLRMKTAHYEFVRWMR